MLVTNHVYDVVGSYIPMKEIGGGTGLKYAASTIAMLTKKKDIEGTDVVGNLIKVKTYKSRFSKENKDVTVRLSFDKGLDRYFGLVELAEKYEVFKKVSTRLEMPDGTKVFAKSIMQDPTKYFTEDVMAQLEVAAHKEFSYGQDDDDRENDTGMSDDE